MSTTRYYRARCGSLYRVTHTPARPATKTSKAIAASILQDRRSIYATEFSPAYPTTADEVARLVSIGSFIEVPCP
ncbi:hypothetical protein [Hymenobacter terricola]|uniref:hypothetical protein n=1 Tax=Hymenobacter terricola TaxID=2819236 RepID=UPI001B310BDA|nr:hypothetical protein [Hymenobacter terricola]